MRPDTLEQTSQAAFTNPLADGAGHTFLIVLCAGLAAVQLYRFLKGRGVDWSGIAFAIGFVALAFYLRHATGLG